MDCVIPIGTGSKHNNLELRYSLRSLEMYSNAGNVCLIGEKPDWYTGHHLPHYEQTLQPTLNIWQKVRAACLCDQISDPFLFSNDDFFFCQPFTCEGYPDYTGPVTSNSPYKELVRHTQTILRRSGLSDMFYDVHRPMVISKERFLLTYEFFEHHILLNQSVVMKSCYGNLWELPPTEICDAKLVTWQGDPGLDMFSIADSCIDVAFRAWLENNYPEKSKWEL